jgi:prepilin-type N-terminal cleavage/methylation domain-containing protein
LLRARLGDRPGQQTNSPNDRKEGEAVMFKSLRSAAFTLFEMLIVVAIVGLLVAVNIPGLVPSAQAQSQRIARTGLTNALIPSVTNVTAAAVSGNTNELVFAAVPWDRELFIVSNTNSTAIDIKFSNVFAVGDKPDMVVQANTTQVIPLGGGLNNAIAARAHSVSNNLAATFYQAGY